MASKIWVRMHAVGVGGWFGGGPTMVGGEWCAGGVLAVGSRLILVRGEWCAGGWKEVGRRLVVVVGGYFLAVRNTGQ